MSLTFRVDKLNTEILLSEFKNGLNILIDGEKGPSYLKKKKRKVPDTSYIICINWSFYLLY